MLHHREKLGESRLQAVLHQKKKHPFLAKSKAKPKAKSQNLLPYMHQSAVQQMQQYQMQTQAADPAISLNALTDIADQLGLVGQ